MNSRPHAQPVRLLMTADAVGGVWTYAVALLRALGDQVRCTLAVMGPPPSSAAIAELAECRNVVLEHRPFALEWMPGAKRDARRAGRWLVQLAKAEEADLVHVNGYAHAACRFDRPVLVVAHSCVRSWWRAVEGRAAPPEWDAYAADVSRGLACASVVVAPTYAMLAALRAEYGFGGPSSVVANGLPDAPPSPPTRRPVVFAAGRVWDRALGLVTLERAAAAGLSWPVVIAGAGDGRARPRGAAIHLGQVDRSVVTEWMRQAAIYAWPALYEPFGLSVLEAAQRGCALVLADVPSLRELWSGAARFVRPGDVPAWRNTLDSLAGDPAERGRLADAARVRACEYSARQMARRYAAIYDLLVRDPEAALCAS